VINASVCHSPSTSEPFYTPAYKGKQLTVSSTKSKTAYQTGYFGKTFDRVMEGEAYSDPVKVRRQEKLKQAQKNLSKAFFPTSGSKKPSGPGSHFGTISGPIEAFSAANKDKDKYKSPGRNFTTTPGKKGTGYGYLGVTIGSYHKHEVEPYDNAKELRKSEQEVHQKKMKGGHFKLNGHPKGYFHPNPFRADKALPPIDEPRTSKDKPKPFKPSSPAKKAGGCKAGTFDHYPKHSEDPYSPAKQKSSGKDSVRKIFKPSPGPKSMPTKSVVTQSVHRRMNVTNFMQTTPVT
jgi:hypothetical protein